MKVDIEKIEALMEVMERHEIAVLEVKEGETEIRLEHARGALAPAAPPPVVSSAPPVVKEEAPVVEAGNWITSPMVGTFYRAASPDAPPFIKEGDAVSSDTVVCIVEAMKVMNEVKAGISGTVTKIKPSNGDAVEFGSELFLVS